MTYIFFIAIGLARIVQIIAKKYSSSLLNDHRTFVGYALFYILTAAIISFIPFAITRFSNVDLPTVLCGTFIGLLFDVGFFIGMNVLKRCSVALVTLFEMGGLIVTCFINWIWLGEAMSVVQIAFLFIYIIGIYFLVSTGKDDSSENKGTSIDLKTLIELIILLFVEGFTSIAQKYFALRIENGNVYALQFFQFSLNVIILFIIFAVVNAKSKEYKLTDPLPKKLRISGFGMSLSIFVIGTLATIISKTVPTIIVFPIMSCMTVIISCFVGVLVFKEKFNRRKLFGIIIALLSIICICIFTNANLNAWF